ncbi:MAG: hypothetical protein HY329_25450, partial [Chloroflexi bacterium]|nr:hypothetical protein [Chloroflexota bacterium]
RGVGIDIEPAYLDLYQQVCLQEGLDQQIAIADDARNLESHDAITRRRFALILTDPPYSEMLSRPQDGEKKKKTGSSSPTPFTNRPEDLGNVTYDVFLTELTEIIRRSVRHLRDRGYLVVFAKDLQPNEAHHNMLHADIVAHLSQLPGLQFRGYKIWYDQTINLYPFGYPYQFVANQLHQYILIFQKRPPRRPRPGELTQLMLEPVLAPGLNGNGHNGATNGVFDGDGLGQH